MTIDVEKEFIDFAYHQTDFSNLILESFDDVVERMKSKGRLFISSETLFNQEVMIKDIVGSAKSGEHNQYAGKAWIDVVIDAGYLRDDIASLFYKMEQKIAGPLGLNAISSGQNIGRVKLIKVANKLYILDGHKRIALARYFSFMRSIPAKLIGVDVIDLKLTK